MAERPASIARSPLLRFVLKNVNCNVWKFYFQAHFQTLAARSQKVASIWERSLGSAGHALVYRRCVAAIHEGRFWVPVPASMNYQWILSMSGSKIMENCRHD